jgi:hypothetical protein
MILWWFILVLASLAFGAGIYFLLTANYGAATVLMLVTVVLMLATIITNPRHNSKEGK